MTDVRAETLRQLNDPEWLAEQRGAGKKLADVEFQADVAGRIGPLGYAMELNPDIARYIGTEHSNPMEVGGLSLGADEKWPESKWVATRNDGYEEHVTIQPGEVAAIGIHANPETWAHEYKHQELDTSELGTRLHDAYSAMNKDEWDSVIQTYANWKGIPFEKAEKRFINSGYNGAKFEHKRGARMPAIPEPSTIGEHLVDVLTPDARRGSESHYSYRQQRPENYITRELRRRREQE
jgi:hypothetical protein